MRKVSVCSLCMEITNYTEETEDHGYICDLCMEYISNQNDIEEYLKRAEQLYCLGSGDDEDTDTEGFGKPNCRSCDGD